MPKRKRKNTHFHVLCFTVPLSSASSLCAFSDFQQCYQNNDVVSNLLLDPSRITATLPGNVCQALKNVLQCHRNKLGSLSVSGCSSVLKGRLSYNTKVVNKILSNFCSREFACSPLCPKHTLFLQRLGASLVAFLIR